MKHKKLLTALITIITLIILVIFWQFKIANHYPKEFNLQAKDNFWGVTFSKRYAIYLQISWRELFLAIVDDLGVRHIRLPVYWNDIETASGQYDWSDYDWLLSEAKQREVKIIPVLGRRQPRWPECHIPDWAEQISESEQQAKIQELIKLTIERYRYYDNIIAWQVENEAFLDSFGICPPSDIKFLEQEIALVRSLDPRPILITGSGELSNWKREAKLGDYFGTTLYRVVWGRWSGYLRYPMGASNYSNKARKAGLSLDRTLVAELQAEPWAPGDIRQLDQKLINKSFSAEQFKANLDYAIKTNFHQSYLWGVEWWYYQKQHGNSDYWNIAKGLKW
jgi:hypothetical protein